MNYIYVDSAVGPLTLAEANGALTHLTFGQAPPPGANERSTPLLKQASDQLAEYFAGGRRRFELPLEPFGTPFQRAVWGALRAIPYGETRRYKDIACAIKNPNALRAVGMANNRNPLAILIPCHRVIGSDGSLTGYGGGLDKKAFLLRLEQQK